MQRLGYIYQEIKETKEKIWLFLYCSRKYIAQNLGISVGSRRLLYGEVGMMPHWTRETQY